MSEEEKCGFWPMSSVTNVIEDVAFAIPVTLKEAKFLFYAYNDHYDIKDIDVVLPRFDSKMSTIISNSRLKDLEESEEALNQLIAAGVDNWEGYENAFG